MPLVQGIVRVLFAIIVASASAMPQAAAAAAEPTVAFPPSLSSYPAPADQALLWGVLLSRISAEPFNLVATIIFFLAIIHTFLAPYFLKLAHRFEHEHRIEIERQGRTAQAKPQVDSKDDVSFKASIFHFLGEIEAIFGMWVIPLLLALTLYKDWATAKGYLTGGLRFTEPMFVVIVMTIAASRPILKLAESLMAVFVKLGKGSALAWWLSILTVGPVLGSFITEPAAMTICALLLAQKFFDRNPAPRLAYATIGLLFVNISVGGTLTHFAAPPVLMVAGEWGWDMPYMFFHFGWKAVVGITLANLLYLLCFWREFRRLGAAKSADGDGVLLWENRNDPVPFWVTAIHVLFLVWTVANNHYPVLFIAGFLFFLAFSQATEHHQNDINLRPALLVGFFLAGLVVHGGLQGWWIEPVLSSLTKYPLFVGATLLTAFNDNAAITYLASLVPGFGENMKYAVVAGAVTGGGLTVIANAPNPAGQSILSRYFPDGVSPLYLAGGAFLPTIIVAICFLIL